MKSLSGKITEQDMIDMNYRADVQGEDLTVIARSFLEQKGLLKQ